jgi:hypothetical protein
MIEQTPVGEDIRLFCPRCNQEVAKIYGKLFWKIKESFPMFCVYHPGCDGLKVCEILAVPHQSEIR